MSSEGATGNSVRRNINEKMIIAQRAAIELLFSCPSVSASFEMENMANIYVIKEAMYKIAKQGIFFLISPLQAIAMQRISIINPVIKMVINFLFISDEILLAVRWTLPSKSATFQFSKTSVSWK